MRYAFYSKYSGIPAPARAIIRAKLGISRGKMRRYAQEQDPPTVVAFNDQTPIGWSIVIKEPALKERAVHIFVAKAFRRQGIATTMFDILVNEAKLKNIRVDPASSKGGRHFFDTVMTWG